MADFARVTAPLERLEPRLVLDGTLANDLAAFANLLRTNGATLYGAAWDATRPPNDNSLAMAASS